MRKEEALSSNIDKLLKHVGNDRIKELENQIIQMNQEFNQLDKDNKNLYKRVTDLEKENQELYDHVNLAEDLLYAVESTTEKTKEFLEALSVAAAGVTSIINNKKPRRTRKKIRKRR